MSKRIYPIYIYLILLAGAFLSFKESGKITIHTIGDSTMANKDTSKNNPERGWGQIFTQFFNDQVVVNNMAKNGRSTKSFITEGLWKKVLDSLHSGDYVFIQFGHNDSKPDTARHTDPQTTFRANLTRFITETRAKKANPVLLTSIVRRHFDSTGVLLDTHGEYVTVVRAVAQEMKVPLIDMEQKSRKLVELLGPEESKKIYLWAKPGEYPRFPEGSKDDTHFCKYGATEMAKLVVEGMKETHLKIVKYLK